MQNWHVTNYLSYLIQVFDLSDTQPPHFVQYGLTCLENLGDNGDNLARVIRENLRVMVYFLELIACCVCSCMLELLTIMDHSEVFPFLSNVLVRNIHVCEKKERLTKRIIPYH